MKNQNVAFMLAEKELKKAGTPEEKIRILRKLVDINPQGSEARGRKATYRRDLKKLSSKQALRKGPVSQNPYDGINYERQVVLVGEANSGRSTLLNALTEANTMVSETPYTTYKPESALLKFNDVPIQIVEIPPVYKGDSHQEKYTFIRNSDVVCVTARDEASASFVGLVLEDHLILSTNNTQDPRSHKHRHLDEIIEKPTLVASWEVYENDDVNVVDFNSVEEIGREIYRLLDIQRVYCASENGEIDGDPLVFPRTKDITVQDFAKRLGRLNIRGARIYGDPQTIEGETVGKDYHLIDGTRVRLRR